MKLNAVLFLFASAVSLAMATGATGVQAQVYPTKPIKIIIPFPPGNTPDLQARLFGPILTERLGQPVVVENRPGAGGTLGMNLVAKAPPDGYTIAGAQSGNLCVLPHTSKSTPYNPLKDFAPIAMTTTNYQIVYAYPGAPFKTLPEMIAYAKAHPDEMTVGIDGEGGFPHLSFELMRSMTGFTYNRVPYKGAAQLDIDLMGGQIQVSMGGVGPRVGHIQSRKLRLLAVSSKNRQATFPDTPAVCEYVPEYESRGWFGFVAPAGTPQEIVNKLNAEINRAMRLPHITKQMVNNEMAVVTESPKYFEEVIKRDYDKLGKVVRDIGYKPH